MKRAMNRNVHVLGLTLLVFLGSVSSASNNAPAKIVNGLVSNAVSMAMKSIWSLKATTKTATTGRPLMKFESGYNVETVFDGSKLGIEPHSIEVLPNGELLVLDSANSNLYRISSSLSLYSRPRLVAGSAEGYAGHVDGKARDARMNHPKGIAVDDRGNVYIADTMNMAIRKLSDAGISTIAGGKWGRGGGHVDGPSEDAKFSDDFDVVYIGSSCSLLVIDRGNKAIREIQLHFDDCAYQYGTGFPLGIAMLLGAGFFGYMLALLQRRVGTIVSSQNDQIGPEEKIAQPYQKPASKSFRPPLIPTDDEPEKQEEGFFGSLARLLVNAGTSATDILGGVFPFLRRTSPPEHHHHHHQKQHYSWPPQESFVIPDSDEPPPPAIEARTPTPRKTYPFMSMDAEKIHQLRQSRIFYNTTSEGVADQNQNQNQNHHHLRKYESPGPPRAATCYFEPGREIVFGAVQEEERPRGRRLEAVQPVDYSDPVFDHHNIRYRFNGYNNGYGT